MSKLFTGTELTSELVLALAALCDTPYEIDAISAAVTRSGWQIEPLEDWETRRDPWLRVKVPDCRAPFIAVWGFERMAGLPLAVIFEDDVTVGLTEAVVTQFAERFADAKDSCDSQLGPSVRAGTYESPRQPFPLHFAFYQRSHATFALLQHDEGDLHVGNVATLDIRVIPEDANSIVLPLATNLIF